MTNLEPAHIQTFPEFVVVIVGLLTLSLLVAWLVAKKQESDRARSRMRARLSSVMPAGRSAAFTYQHCVHCGALKQAAFMVEVRPDRFRCRDAASCGRAA